MEKKKRRPNLIDIVFLLLIVGLVMVAYFLIHGSDEENTVTRSYVVELTELYPDMADAVSVGDKVTDNVKNYDMGVVTAVEVTPYTVVALDEESGIYRETEVPGKITLLLTIEAETTETEQTISTVSGYELRIGTSVSCTVSGLTGAGYIIGLER